MNQKLDIQDLSNNPSERVDLLFRSISKLYREHLMEKSKVYGFTGPQFGLMVELHKNPFSTLKEMSERMGLSKSTVSAIVDRLVGLGIVVREIPDNNRRTVRLSLEPEFCKNNVLKEIRKQYVSDTLKGASEEDINKIISGLELLHSLFEKNNEPG